MQKITPHLWFDKEAGEAADFYASVFPDAAVTMKSVVKDTPSGDTEMVSFTIMGYSFMAISAGPLFKINPSISFHVKCSSVEQVDEIWNKLSVDGKIMMEIGEYPFSKRYGWVQDKYGVSWQLIYTEGEVSQRITPVLLFAQEHTGQAEDAGNFYASVFKNASYNVFSRKGELVQYAQLTIDGQEFGLMDADSKEQHAFTFTEAVSLIVNCKDQEEIDYFWEKLSAVPESEQCGWVKDKYGVSWQVIPENMGALIGKNPEKTMPVMLSMKKIVIAELEQAGN